MNDENNKYKKSEKVSRKDSSYEYKENEDTKPIQYIVKMLYSKAAY